MAWIKDLYRNTHGLDLGVFGGAIRTFKAQSTKWEPITKTFVSEVIVLLQQFIIKMLDLIVGGFATRSGQETLRRYKRVMDKAVSVLKVEREKKPFITMNHYFNESLQKARSERLTDVVKGSVGKEFVNTNGRSYSPLG
jgi:hypothetical protein